MIPVRWGHREPPLPIAGVVAVGEAASRLAERVLRRDSRGLTAVAGDDLLCVVGPAEQLPWCDGVVWLGSDPLAPSLMMPTVTTPLVHPALLAAKLGGRWLLVPDLGLQVSLSSLAPIWSPSLRSWLDART